MAGEQSESRNPVQGANDAEFRPDSGFVEAVAARLMGTQLPPLLSDEERAAAEAKRAADDELAAGRDVYRGFFWGL